MEKRTFTKEEKLRIIKKASENGVNPTLEKYGVYRASYYTWKQKFEEMGEEGFHHGMPFVHRSLPIKAVCSILLRRIVTGLRPFNMALQGLAWFGLSRPKSFAFSENAKLL